MTFQHEQLKIKTADQHWIIPFDCELLKATLEHQKITADKLTFSSNIECNRFIKQLFLLALEDQISNQRTSEIALFGRELMEIQKINNCE